MPSALSCVAKERPNRFASSFKPLARSVSIPVLMAYLASVTPKLALDMIFFAMALQ